MGNTCTRSPVLIDSGSPVAAAHAVPLSLADLKQKPPVIQLDQPPPPPSKTKRTKKHKREDSWLAQQALATVGHSAGKDVIRAASVMRLKEPANKPRGACLCADLASPLSHLLNTRHHCARAHIEGDGLSILSASSSSDLSSEEEDELEAFGEKNMLNFFFAAAEFFVFRVLVRGV